MPHHSREKPVFSPENWPRMAVKKTLFRRPFVAPFRSTG